MKESNRKTALLTGGNGNLGRLVGDKLLDRDMRVVKFDVPGTEPATVRDNEEIVTGNIRDVARMEELLSQYRPDIVYHFASLLSGSSAADPEAAWEINATGSFHLLRLAAKLHIDRFFFASTSASYGGALVDPLPENAEQWPENLYGATKAAVERVGVYFKLRHDLDFRCLRFPLVLSPFAPRAAVTAYPSHAFRAALNGESFTFPVSPGIGMSTIFLEDVVDGIVKFTLAPRIAIEQHAYNLHSYFVSAQSVANEISKRIPEFRYDFEPIATVEALLDAWPDIIVDTSARKDWDWNPRFDFEKSAERMFELLRLQ